MEIKKGPFNFVINLLAEIAVGLIPFSPFGAGNLPTPSSQQNFVDIKIKGDGGKIHTFKANISPSGRPVGNPGPVATNLIDVPLSPEEAAAIAHNNAHAQEYAAGFSVSSDGSEILIKGVWQPIGKHGI